MERIGIVGLGRMGSAMAERLAAQDLPVTGWTRSGLTESRAAELGIARADDLTALVAASDILLLSLFDDAAVAETLDRLISRDVRGKLVVDTSTVSPIPFRDRIAALAEAGLAAIDAPISGGPEMVTGGTCGIFIGGAAGDVARADPVLAALTERRFHLGPLGAGMVMKTLNNTLLQGYVATLRQILPLAKKAGISLEDAMRILATGPAGNPFLADRLPRILGEDDSVGFALKGAAKDTDVFIAVAAAHGVTIPVLTEAQAGMYAALEAGLGEKDPAALLATAYHKA